MLFICKKAVTLRFCGVFFILSLISFLIAKLGGEDASMIAIVNVPIELCICVILILGVMRWRKMNADNLIDIIIISGIIQSIICCAMIALPGFRDAINELRLPYMDEKYIGWSSIRLLGYADGLFHTTPIVQAVISILLLKKSEKKPYLFIFVITTMLSALLNSRTSFVVWAMCFPFYFIYTTKRAKKRSVIYIGITALLFSSLMISLLNENVGDAVDYFVSGMNEIDSASKGKGEGFFEDIGSWIVFPKGIDFFVGIGCDTYGKINNPEYHGIHTDYGFVNNIWTYGIIGTIIMVSLYYKTIKYTLKLNLEYKKIIFCTLLISFIIGHFKGIITSYNDFTVLLLLISSSTVLDTTVPLKWTNLLFEIIEIQSIRRFFEMKRT